MGYIGARIYHLSDGGVWPESGHFLGSQRLLNFHHHVHLQVCFHWVGGGGLCVDVVGYVVGVGGGRVGKRGGEEG